MAARRRSPRSRSASRVEELRRGDLVLDVADHGPLDGEVVVLLHGWPAGAASWEQVVPRLVDAGHRVVVPDQRGYSPRARPRGRRPYRLTELVADVRALVGRLGSGPVHLVGHDWGGAVAWALAASDPGLVASLVVLSTPHPGAVRRALLTSAQPARSAYIGFFQVPAVPEAVLLAGGGAVARWALERSGLERRWAERYVERMREPGALRASLGWYRALPLSAGDAPGDVAVPTLYAWSTGDAALGRRAAELTADHVTGPYRFEVLEGVSHWIPEEAPDVVARLVVAHARDHPSPVAPA